MVICLVARRIWTHGLGGMEEHCRNAAMELARQGHTVHVLTTAHPDGRACETAYGATVHYLSGTPPGDYSRAWRRASRRWAREHFPALGVDAVLSMSVAAYGLVGADGPPIYTIIVGWLPGQLRSCWRDASGWRRLVDVPRSARWQLAIWLRGRRLLRRSKRILAVSHAVAHELRRYRRVCLLPNYVDTSQFVPSATDRARVRAELGFTDQHCVALMTSTITWQKGVHLGLRACAAVADTHPGLAAVVAGDGPAAAPIAAEARRMAPRLPVRFLGARPHDDLPSLYAAADLFLLPSLRVEGLPTTVLEAMSAGLPVVAMRAGGTATAVIDGRTGLLVRQGDLAAFTEALHALVDDPERRRAMGTAGRARAVAEFDQSIVVRRMIDIMSGSGC
jgi:glycosyltransferase involved in cell wall biosynthesis